MSREKIKDDDGTLREGLRGSAPELKALNVLPSVALTGVAVLMLLRLADPLSGDGSLFLLTGEMVSRGEALYVDVWDVKQPGIFYLYSLAAALFGYDFLGVQIIEALLWASVSVLIVRMLGPHLQMRHLAVLVPVGFLGVYYGYSKPLFHAQIEALATGPLVFCALLLAAAPGLSGRRRFRVLFLAGVLAGVTLLLKLALVPILAGFFCLWLVESAAGMRPPGRWQRLGKDVLAMFLGMVLVVAAAAGHLLSTGSLGEAFRVSFQTGPQWAIAAQPAPVSRLVFSLTMFARAVLPLALLALLGLLSFRSNTHRGRIARFMGAWLVLGLVAIVIQRFSWWPYHLQLLYMPMAVLAVLGLDDLLGRTRHRRGLPRVTAGIVVAFTLITAALSWGHTAATRAAALYRHRADLAAGSAEDYRSRIDDDHAQAASTAAAVNPLPAEATVFVMGDPTVYVLLGKTQPVPVHGWSLEFLSADQWGRLARDLDEARPDAVFVSSDYAELVKANSDSISSLLTDAYAKIETDTDGDWYVVQDERSLPEPTSSNGSTP